MKRLALRVSIVAGLVAVVVFAIAQARSGSQSSSRQAQASPARGENPAASGASSAEEHAAASADGRFFQSKQDAFGGRYTAPAKDAEADYAADQFNANDAAGYSSPRYRESGAVSPRAASQRFGENAESPDARPSNTNASPADPFAAAATATDEQQIGPPRSDELAAPPQASASPGSASAVSGDRRQTLDGPSAFVRGESDREYPAAEGRGDVTPRAGDSFYTDEPSRKRAPVGGSPAIRERSPNIGATTAPLDGAGDVEPRDGNFGRYDRRPPAVGGYDQAEAVSHQESFPSPGLKDAVLADEGEGVPGDKRLEGAQLSALSIIKTGPEEIQVGKPAYFEIHVQNTGRVAAQGVIVRDQVPRGASFRSASPKAAVSPSGDLEWPLDTLQPGEKRNIKIELLPVREGVVGSVATVYFAAQASVRTVCTRPELRIEVLSPPSEVLVGDELALNIRVSNPGTGEATGVLLTEHLPPGLRHSEVKGDRLEYEVGSLKPKESRDIKLRLMAVQRGPLENLVTAVGEGSVRAEAKTRMKVVAPELSVRVDGPKHRYLERPAVYHITLKNEGTAPAKDVQLTAYVPKGFKFISTNNLGEFDSTSRMVSWELSELPPNLPAVVEVKVVPTTTGDHKFAVETKGRQDLFAQTEHSVRVEGVAAVQFQVIDTADPIEIGGETTYEIRVVNQGTKTATDVRLSAIVPPELRAVAATGPSDSQIRGNQVHFFPVRTLAPKADVTFKVRANAVGPGNPQLRIELTSGEVRDPVVKHESTRVYADQ